MSDYPPSIHPELLQARVMKALDVCIARAEAHFGREFNYQDALFNLRGRAAGQIRYLRRGRTLSNAVFRFNFSLLQQYSDEFVRLVVPHEVAHLVAYCHYGLSIKPHGLEWKSVMQDVYDLEPKVTHSFDVPSKKRAYFHYVCSCEGRRHELSAIRHNRIMQQKRKYVCKSCDGELRAG